jgi:hypothetical protein
MNWYAAKIIFQIVNNSKEYAQFDEQIRLINAINIELALEIANQTGLMSQEEIISKDGTLLQWKFIAVTEVQDIGDLVSGKEIHYAINEPEEVSLYVQRVLEKSLNLKKLISESNQSESLIASS